MTVSATGDIYPQATPTLSAPVIGKEAPGNKGVVIGGPVSAGTTFWEVAFDDQLTGWVDQDGLAAVSPTVPTLSFSASPAGIALGASATLSWSSTNATSCSGVGFSPSRVSGSASVSPTVSTTYQITCIGSSGSTTRTTPVIVKPFPAFTWGQSLPVPFKDPAIVPFGGTETRALVFMDGSLYAGIGDDEDPQLDNPRTPGAQVLRLDSPTPTGSWVEDKDFNEVVPSTGRKDYLAVSVLGTAHFDRDSGNNSIAPVDVLMAGFWNFGVAGVTIGEKTVTTGSVGGRGTWTEVPLVAPSQKAGQVRSFGSYTDSVTHVEMAFAGSSPYGIFSGAFDSATKVIHWGATAEAGTADYPGRVMSFAACGGKLYASVYDAIVVRTDGENPSWRKFYKYYSDPAVNSHTFGFRGLTCLPNLNGAGSMLIAALEGNPLNIYDIPLDGSQPTIELHASNFLSSQLGRWVGFDTAAYNNMTVDPQSGTPGCPDLLMGLDEPTAFLVRHCNGVYGFRAITTPMPLRTIRSLAVSQFPGDPAGTIYAGGYNANAHPAHNTDWIYRGSWPGFPEILR